MCSVVMMCGGYFIFTLGFVPVTIHYSNLRVSVRPQMCTVGMLDTVVVYLTRAYM